MRTHALCCAGVAALVLAVGAATGDAAPEPARPCTPIASAAYTSRVAAALRAGRDVWGDRLLAAVHGPTYAAAARLLVPLLGGRTEQGRNLTGSGIHYLPLAMPRGPRGAGDAMLHVADGGELIARRVSGPSIEISVGRDGRERFGSCLTRSSQARLAGGWLPILRTGYRDAAGNRYEQESFAARTGRTLASFVRLTASTSHEVDLRIGAVSRRVLPSSTETLYVRWAPPAAAQTVEAGAYEAARESVVAYWRARLAEGARIDVPEPVAQNALRALLVQSLTLTWRYSFGNPYEQFSFPETVDVARTLGEYGFGDVERSMLSAALPARPTPYPNWKMGEKLLGFACYYDLYRDRATIAAVTPTLSRFVLTLERQLESRDLLPRERYSSDIADAVYGLHAQATIWQGLRGISAVWGDTGRPRLAVRAGRLAERLGQGLRAAVRRSERRLADGSLFLPMRLLDDETPYQFVTASREGSYWNLVAPYVLASGLFRPESAESRGALRYVLLHGARLLGVVRTAAFVLYGDDAGVDQSGVNPVYGASASRFLADLDRPDRLVLSLYGHLATGLTRGTFVGGEGTSVAMLDGAYHRTTYRPPNAAANATVLETLRLMLVHETTNGLELAFATPRAWLAPGKRVAVSRVPTRFGPVSYSIAAGPASLRIRVDAPSRRRPKSIRLRLRLPAGERVGAVTPTRPVDAKTQTIDLSGLRGSVELEVRRER